MRLAKVQGSAKPTPAPESSQKIRSRLLQNISKSISTSRAVSPDRTSSANSNLTLEEREAINYADQVINPRLAPIWEEVGPSRGDLGEGQTSTIEILFTVLPDGRITLLRISRHSNSAAMNRAGEAMLQRIQGLQLPNLAASGIKSTKLNIRITLAAQAIQG